MCLWFYSRRAVTTLCPSIESTASATGNGGGKEILGTPITSLFPLTGNAYETS